MKPRDSRPTRRRFIKTAGAAGVVGLAGSKIGSAQDGGNQFNNVSIKYWSVLNAQSRAARSRLEEFVNQFESDTGASVQVNWSGPSEAIGAVWLNQFRNNNFPHVFEGGAILHGQFISGGWVEPMENHLDMFDDQVRSNIEWTFDMLRELNFAGYEEVESNIIHTLPFTFMPRAPFVARMDHFEEAGLDPENDYPPESFDDLVEIATTLQEEGPARKGYQVHAVQGDVTDTQHMQWAHSIDAQQGRYLNDDWSDTNVDNEVWKQATRQYVETSTEHDLSPPPVSSSDEQAVGRLINDQISMTQADFFTHAEYLEQAPDMMENGTIQWGPAWPGEAGQRSVMTWQNLAVTTKPPDVDEAKFERQQEAALEFVRRFYEDQIQLASQDWLGTFPVRQDLWDQLPSANHKFTETALTMAEETDSALQLHPRLTDIMFSIPAPPVQQAFQGEISPSEANDRWAQQVREVL